LFFSATFDQISVPEDQMATCLLHSRSFAQVPFIKPGDLYLWLHFFCPFT